MKLILFAALDPSERNFYVLLILLAIMIIWLLMKIALIGWLVWDRKQQQLRDADRTKHESELYHSVRNLLAATKGRIEAEESKRQQTAHQIKEELKEEIKKVPEPTAEKVVDKLEKIRQDGDSGFNKKPPVPPFPA